MSISFDQSKDEIAKLCHYFEVNRKSFLASGIKEAHVRQSLIDPFFETLGWDVRNSSRIAPQYREVVPEDSLDVEGHQKAPDYTFRVGTLPKFYAEAKKCGINISADPGPAYQLRRYAFSAKLALSILTDFEELGVYECSSRPRPSDKSSHSRIQYFHFEEYPDKWREIWDIFSREAVWSGSFDQYITSKRKRGTSEVDTEFLKDIEQWRESLARNIALRNPLISVLDLNAAVQRTIDRIIFLRMAEDRGLEPYAQILKLCEQPDIYRRFITGLCRKADERYNSGLFHFQKEPGISDAPDTITPRLIIDDKTLKPIIQSLYFEYGSPYHFGVLPVEILGTVYERFLGKVIRLTAGHQAKVEEKPEVRKAGGIYYTPSYIVDYIVKNTVGKQVEGKSPAQIAKCKDGQPIRILDMACGSGSFLLGAYQYLLDHCTKWYEANEPEKHTKAVFQDSKGIWRLTISERKRILTTHIFGVDIDHQAAEVTKLSLLIKALEGENDSSLTQQMKLFQERALPNLSNHIKCGNSLIGPDYFSGTLFPDPEELSRINPFDWKVEFPEAMAASGFNCVIGNPPYGAFFGEGEKEYIRKKYKSYKYKYDSYIYFIDKALQLVAKKGAVSFISPELWLKLESCAPLRKLIAEDAGFSLLKICGENVFLNAVVNTIVFLLHRSVEIDTLRIELKDESWTIPTSVWLSAKNFVIDYQLKSDITELVSKINTYGQPFSTFGEVIQGITPYDRYRGQDSEIIKNRGYHATYKKDSTYYKWLAGKDLSRYSLYWSGEWLSYGLWLAAPRDPRFFDGPRLIFREIPGKGKRIQATYVEQEKYYHGHSVTPFKLFSDNKIDLKYLLGLVNSKLLSWHGGLILPNFGKAVFPKLNPQDINALLIRPINFLDPVDKERHNKMVQLVEQMLDMHKRYKLVNNATEQQQLQRIIDATDRQIDRLVYELYGLTQEEIEIVEAASK